MPGSVPSVIGFNRYGGARRRYGVRGESGSYGYQLRPRSSSMPRFEVKGSQVCGHTRDGDVATDTCVHDAAVGEGGVPVREAAVRPSSRPRRMQCEAAHFAARDSHVEEIDEDAMYRQIECDRDEKRYAYECEGLDCGEIDERMKQYAKQKILDAVSNKDLMMKAEVLVNEDWLGSTNAMPGNIYSIAAFGGFDGKQDMTHMSRGLGFVLITLIQVFGPLSILLSRTIGEPFVWHKDNLTYQWECWNFPGMANLMETAGTMSCLSKFDTSLFAQSKYPHSEFIPLTFDWEYVFITKLLGIVFIFAFTLNGLFVMMDECRTWENLYNTFRYLKHHTPNYDVTGDWLLGLGALVNCWVVVLCCIDVYLVVGASRAPTDLLMDSLGMLFLYNLDDVGGDLGFVDEDDWPGLRLAWIFSNIVQEHDAAARNEIRQGDVDVSDKHIFLLDKLDWQGSAYLGVFTWSQRFLMLLLFVLPMLAVFTPFLVIAPA